MVVRSVHFFDAVSGCTSLPDALSHETWVYPSSAAASRCVFGDFVVSVEPVVRADQDVVLVFEIVLHVFSLYPNTNADDFCMVVRSVHFFDAVSGCTSLPDA